MQRPWIASLAAIALVLGVLAIAPVAEARHGDDRYDYGDDDWTFAAGIRLGGFQLSIGYQPVRFGQPTYYYRTRDHVRYDDYHCTDRCYRRERTYYHHERCPVILHLMHVERVHPDFLFYDHAPHYDGRWSSYDPYAFHRDYRGREAWERENRQHHRYEHHGREHRYDRRHDDRHWKERRHDRGRHEGWDRGRGQRRH